MDSYTDVWWGVIEIDTVTSVHKRQRDAEHEATIVGGKVERVRVTIDRIKT